MKKICFCLLATILFVKCEVPPIEIAELSIIPQPKTLVEGDGEIIFGSDWSIVLEDEFQNEGEFLQDWIEEYNDLSLPISSKNSEPPQIILSKAKSDIPNEGYILTVSEVGIEIEASHAAGCFQGIQTLLQILTPYQPISKEQVIALPYVVIQDEPAFRHRGMLLDCCRHFMDKDFVKRYIDLLAYHKMNILHWHLTEDQGWRIEIKKYPNLADVGAWRYGDDGTPYGGFYTQDDIREIVQYATDRHITVIPEIELPGHSSAAISAYPWLSCTQEQIPVETEWGVFKDIYCAGNDSTLTFLKDVLTEVMELFPSEYIHIGGDEAPKYRWENCDKCQNRIQTMGLHDEHELQSWFIEDVGKFLEENGRKLIGWDEILEGGLPEGSAVQSWRGFQGGIDAANAGHEVVMSPTSHCYFDYGLESTDMEEVYNFDPIPEGLEEDKQHFVIGGECNMWTEHAPQETIDSKVFPRILALSEVLWSYPAERDYEEFQERVIHHLVRLDAIGVDYGFEAVPVAFNVSSDSGLVLTAEPLVADLEMKFRYEGDDDWKEYLAPIEVDQTAFIELEVERRGKIYPKIIEYGLADHIGIGKDFSLNHEYSHWYTGGGDTALFDGILGTMDFRDGHWQALQGGNIDCVIDLGKVQKISELSSRFYLYNNAWIFLPTHVEFQISDDGESWTSVADLSHDIPLEEKQQMIRTFEVEVEVETRYVRLIAHNLGVNPDWHDSPGQASWVFCDEFVVR
jgi:hexosaminidase